MSDDTEHFIDESNLSIKFRNDISTTVEDEKIPQAETNETINNSVETPENQVLTPNAKGDKDKFLESIQTETQSKKNSADQFISWIKSGIQSGLIQVNHAHARVHIVNEGVLHMSPGIFQDYAKSQDVKDWVSIQKNFFKQNWHIKDLGGRNIMKYQVKGKEREKTVNGALILDTALIFGKATVPQPNPHLIKL